MKGIIFSLGLCLVSAAATAKLQKSYPSESEVILSLNAEGQSLDNISELKKFVAISLDKMGIPLGSADDIEFLSRSKKYSEFSVKVNLPYGFSASRFANNLIGNDDILFASPETYYEGDFRETFVEVNDPYFSKQYFHKMLNSVKAWDINSGEEEIVVAVTDDGFHLAHPDLKNIYHQNQKEIANNGIDDDQNGYVDDVLGWDFDEKDNNPDSSYDHGAHGTHVAGIVAAQAGNNEGVIGTAPGVKVMPLKFYGKARWTASTIYKSYAYAIDNGAKIITTSYNIDIMANNPIYLKALKYIADHDGILFNSAGNANRKNSARSSLKNILLVCSVTANSSLDYDKRSTFSNYGRGVDVCAPGDKIYSTLPNSRYGNMRGTSMAAPMAAAVAALIWSQNPHYTNKQVAHQLLTSTKSIVAKNPTYMWQLGTGRIHSLQALQYTPRATQIALPKLRNNQSFSFLNSILVQLDGVSRITKDAVALVHKVSGQLVDLDFHHEGSIGENYFFMKFNLTQKGQYELRFKSELIQDAFGKDLDGDMNLIPGGDFVKTFNIQ